MDFGLSFHVLSISEVVRGSVGFFCGGILRLRSIIFNSPFEYVVI